MSNWYINGHLWGCSIPLGLLGKQLSDTDFTDTCRCTETGRLTIFTRRSSRHSGVVYWIVGCNLLGNQGHYRIIRYLKNRHTCIIQMTIQNKSHLQSFFHLCRFLSQPIRKPIDHWVGVIFYISLHLFWFHLDKQRISYYRYVLYWAHMYVWWLTGGRESLAEHRTGLSERGYPTVSVQ